MSTLRAAALLIAAAAVGGCSTTVRSEAPAGVNLAGNWRLDPAASDDLQKVLANMRAEAIKIIGHRQSMGVPYGGPGGPGGPPRGGQGGSGGGGGGNAGGAGGSVFQPDDLPSARGPPVDPLRHSPMAHIVFNMIARGEFLTITQGRGELVLDFGTSVRRYSPGAHSVVSAEGGVGDQVSGWKGNAYVIEIRAQSGPVVTETFSLSDDGHQLLDKLHISSDELHAVDIRRVYVRTSERAPRATPNAD